MTIHAHYRIKLQGVSVRKCSITTKLRRILTKYFVYIFSNTTRLNENFFRKSDVSRNFDLLRPAGPLNSSLFDASSLESARSAARDMSLFKPHLKASTSSSQGRRQGPSASSHRRGAARQYSGASSSQRASSPPRQQSFKKGEACFHKKSSGTPQKRGGFRK